MKDGYKSLTGIRFIGNGFGKAVSGMDFIRDPETTAEFLLDCLVVTAIASEYNIDRWKAGDLRVVQPERFQRAYPTMASDAAKFEATIKSASDVQRAKAAMVEACGVNDAMADFIGLADEPAVGHPLSCATFIKQPMKWNGHPETEVYSWQSAHRLLGAEYNRINQMLHRPGGKILYMQAVTYVPAYNDFDLIFIWAQERAPGTYIPLFPVRSGTGADWARALKETIPLAYALQFGRRYDWEIEFCMSRARTGIVVSTDAAGALEMLATREKVPRERRAALLHFVREHQRRGKPTAETNERTTSLVRAHLRGRVECEYGGMHVRVWPSQYDIDRACNGQRIEKRLTVGFDSRTCGG